MKILALEQDVAGFTAEDFTPQLKAESARVWELYQAGVLRELYFRADRPSAVLILECANVEESQSILKTLPLVEHGLITFDVIPLIAYPGFARLFAVEESQ